MWLSKRETECALLPVSFRVKEKSEIKVSKELGYILKSNREVIRIRYTLKGVHKETELSKPIKPKEVRKCKLKKKRQKTVFSDNFQLFMVSQKYLTFA